MVTEKKETRPVTMNAFELISMSQGLNLSGLFESKEVTSQIRCTAEEYDPYEPRLHGYRMVNLIDRVVKKMRPNFILPKFVKNSACRIDNK